MVMCLAQLTAQQWTYSDTYVVPIPVPNNPCDTALCTWTCCDNASVAPSHITDPDISERCGCPKDAWPW
jgi:hypothetical protein